MESEIILPLAAARLLHELCHIFDMKIFFKDEKGGHKEEAYLMY
ncbi:MAG TPA: hypothetical protein PLJ49_10795 [Smithella sp.]|jgi:hypothetical protein|nr:hypothetical protein [Smithella sp.]